MGFGWGGRAICGGLIVGSVGAIAAVEPLSASTWRTLGIIASVSVGLAAAAALVWSFVAPHWNRLRSPKPEPALDWTGGGRTPPLPSPAVPPPLTSQVVASLAASPKPETEERVFVDVTPDFLHGFYREHTGIQAQKLAEPYIGKWTKTSGTVASVGPWNGWCSQVRLDRTEFDDVIVFFWFRDESVLDRLSTLQRGDQITALGQIENVDDASVTLDYCEIVPNAATEG